MNEPTKIKVKIVFTNDDICLCGSGKKITAALREAGVKIEKFRYTYVESDKGIAEMPPALMLASFLCDIEALDGFSHKLPSLSGEYEFVFKDYDDE